jgi:peptide/nickel transport system permease protein
MPLFILKRLALAIVTLWILSVIVFAAAQVLPGDPARAILGNLASAASVHALDVKLGTNRPVIDQYGTWLGHIVTGNFGLSTEFSAPIGPILGPAVLNSLKLAGLAFVIVVPLGILGGVIAALRYGTWVDRTLSVFGLSATVIPEVVSGIILIAVLGFWLNVLPVSASGGVGFAGTIYHLIMPAIPLVLILFGYIQQMARAGTVEALNSDYARTATLKGLPRRTMIRRHVLRNSLLPTITVIASQTGYLIGGLVVVEILFHWNGIGTLIYNAASHKDFSMLEATVLVIGAAYMVVTLVADILYSMLNPRIRYRNADAG